MNDKVQLDSKKKPNSLRDNYQRIMPNKKNHRMLIWGIFVLVVSCIVVQLLYPLDKSLPFARVGSRVIGVKNHDEMVLLLNDKFTNSEQIIAASSTDYLKVKTAETGAALQTETMIRKLSDYPLWMRYIPLSLVFWQPGVSELSIDYTPIVLASFSKEASRTLSVDPTDAQLSIRDGRIVASSDQPGHLVSAETIRQQMINEPLIIGRLTIRQVESVKVAPKTSSADLEPLRTQAEASLAKPVTINIGDQSFSPSREERATWLSLIRDADGQTALSIDRSKLTEFLESINQKVGIKPGVTNVTLSNGIETARQTGEPGKRLPTEEIHTQISEQLLSSSIDIIEINTSLVDVTPTIMYNNSYTSSQEGLAAYVRDAARTKNANIVVQQLDGNGWRAAADENLSTVSASTYKLYVSLYLFDQMEKGKTSWSDPMLDTTVSGCFDRMTIASTNPCAEAWLNSWGRDNVNNFVYEHGFSRGTTFTDPVATHTTAADLAKFMIGLEDGSLVGGAYRDRLLHSLSVHPYRSGVPAGSAGQVWDKVGFLWDYVHDAAIVRHPKGRYVIVVMTKGRSYATIAGITREVEKIMYP